MTIFVSQATTVSISVVVESVIGHRRIEVTGLRIMAAVRLCTSLVYVVDRLSFGASRYRYHFYNAYCGIGERSEQEAFLQAWRLTDEKASSQLFPFHCRARLKQSAPPGPPVDVSRSRPMNISRVQSRTAIIGLPGSRMGGSPPASILLRLSYKNHESVVTVLGKEDNVSIRTP